MDLGSRNIIKRYKKTLATNIDFNLIRSSIEKSNIFTRPMLDDIYDPNSGYDFFDELCTRGPYAFSNFLFVLRESIYSNEARILQSAVSQHFSPVFYKMNSVPLGYCKIIINKKFKQSRPRYGADVDARALYNLFEKLGYKVSLEWDLNAKEMKLSLKKFAQDPQLQDVDSCIVFIATHGGNVSNYDVLYGVDENVCNNVDNFVYITDIYSMFDNNHCKMLFGKPKLFFFQACRGLQEDKGVFVSVNRKQTDLGVATESTDATNETINPNYFENKNEIFCPTISDIIVVHSTLPDHASRRDHDDGSWLCQDLVNVFSNDYLQHDLETMLKYVCRRIEERVSENKTKQTIHVEYFGVKSIVHFGRSK